jgi:hypothetical protein
VRDSIFWRISIACAAVLILVLAIALVLLRSPSPRPHSSGHQRTRLVAHAAPLGGLPSLPSCPQVSGPVPATISIASNAAGNNFDKSCYYAVANKQLTIHLTNSVFALSDHAAIPMTLLISPSGKPAMSSVPDNPMLSTTDTSKAVFVGPTVMAPDTVDISVPGLPAGTYALQVAQLPYFVAILVVQ